MREEAKKKNSDKSDDECDRERDGSEEVCGEVGDRAGGAEWKGEEVITRGGKNVENDARVVRCGGQERTVL